MSDHTLPSSARPVAEKITSSSTPESTEPARKKRRKKDNEGVGKINTALRPVSPDVIVVDAPPRPVANVREIIEILDSDDEGPPSPAIANINAYPTGPILSASTTTPDTYTTEAPSRKKKASKASTQDKAEKAARKQARAERRAKRAERRAKRAAKSQPGCGAATIAKVKSGGANVNTEMAAAMKMLAATNKVSKTEKPKKDKPKRTLRAAWAPGGRKDAEVEDVDQSVEERERSPSPLQEVVVQREREAEDRFNKLILEAQFAAVPALRNQASSEPGWQTELRLNSSMAAEQLKAKGIFIKRGRYTPSERALALQEMEAYRKAHGMTHLELQHSMLKSARNEHRQAICRHIVRQLPGRSVKGSREFLSYLCNPHSTRNIGWTTEMEDEVWALNQQYPGNWTKIGELVNLDPHALRRHYVQQLEPRMLGCGDPWTPTEDDELTQLVLRRLMENDGPIESHPKGISWEVVAEGLCKLRTAEQCRDRWSRVLFYRRHMGARTPELKLAIIQRALAADIYLSQDTQWVDVDPTGIVQAPDIIKRHIFGQLRCAARKQPSVTFREYHEGLQGKVIKEVEKRKSQQVETR